MGAADTREKEGKYHKEKISQCFKNVKQATVCMFKHKSILGGLCGGIQNGVQPRMDLEG